VSSLDPVTGGRHCSIGGDPKREFLVTSTLASQAPAAVGRALAIPLSNRLLGKEAVFPIDSISYVSVGDGSINNAHFLSAINLARYSEHGRIKCPTVFVISDNRICISLKGNGYVDKFVSQLQGVHTQVANGQDFVDIYEKSKNVIDYSRSLGRPSVLLINNLPRRFGHAATDRQFAYYTPEEIQGQIDIDPLSDAFSMMLQLGIYTNAELEALFEGYKEQIENAFNIASLEPKIKSRESLINTNSQPLDHKGLSISSSPSVRVLPKSKSINSA
jgi:2-oxoisovalerate dehydrogenase E1 component